MTNERLYPCIDATSVRRAWREFQFSLRRGTGERNPDSAARIERHIRAAADKFGVQLERIPGR